MIKLPQYRHFTFSFYRFFRGQEFSEFLHFVNHPKNFPKVATGTRSFRVPDYFGGRPKPDSTGTRPDSNIGYPNLSGTRTTLLPTVYKLNFVFSYFMKHKQKLYLNCNSNLNKLHIAPSLF